MIQPENPIRDRKLFGLKMCFFRLTEPTLPELRLHPNRLTTESGKTEPELRSLFITDIKLLIEITRT